MITKQLFVLLAVAVVGFSSIFLLPPAPKTQPIGVNFRLPEFVGDWYGENQEVTPREVAILGPGTEFARKMYTNGRGDSVFVSIVLSGQDMNTSIHRPERCLPAQGWTLVDSSKSRVDLVNGNLPHLDLTRLHSFRDVNQDKGRTVRVYNLNYYWFAGSHNLTASHLERSWLDIRDRLVKGYNQRWAYITVASNVTNTLSRFGRNEGETDQLIKTFVRDLAPKILLASQPSDLKS